MTTRRRLLVRLALRNLRRQARRSTLTAAAMIVGGALMIFSLALGDGTHEDWIDSGVRIGTGHIALQEPRFQSSRKIEHRLDADVRDLAQRALEHPFIASEVTAIAPRMSVSGLASSPSAARPVQVVAVDPVAEPVFSIVDDRVEDGRYLEIGDRLGAFLGAGIAEALQLRVGSRFVLTAQSATGDIAGQLVRVVGVFRTGIPEIDQSTVHIPLTTAGTWLSTGEDVTSLSLLVRRSRAVPRVVRALRTELGTPIADGRLTVLSWREAMPELDAAVKVDDLGNYVFQGIMFGIIALAIVNTILMSVLHRHREFGVLQALGFTPRQTGALVMAEGIVLTVVSGLAGISLGLAVTWALWRNGMDISAVWQDDWSFSGVVLDPIIVPYFRLTRIVQGLLFILLVGTVASAYPAWRATRIDVAEAMKFER